ncbi:esterase/lipase/thioesterase [Trifolium pratense]|uniref:Esterase/lipase/thioesterase n=1 Tax=Trifolium pratense TaxID=57577 RepID=A0A2K3N9U1_TRIPR|nr:esterase/lipase/thioesterase [Trifolium pratense]
MLKLPLQHWLESEGSFQYGNYWTEVDDLHAVTQHFRESNRVIRAIVGHSKEPSSDHGKFSTTIFTFCFSTAHATPVNFSSTELVMFQLKISEKLDEKNFLIWLQQIEPAANAHNLSSFLYYIEIPEKFIRDSVTSAIVANPAHRLWILQDQGILSWLQSTISSSIMTGILGCVHASQL